MFSVKLCSGATLSAVEYCIKETVSLRVGCASHVKASVLESSSYRHYYFMMNGADLVYGCSVVYGEGDPVKSIIRFDVKDDDKRFLTISNETGKCN